MKPLRPLLVFGTRPEGIKMAPVVRECLARPSEIEPIVCLTGQHREMLAQVTEYFGITHDVDLDLMRPNQTLAGLTARCIERIDEVLAERQPDCVVAQGDTTTVMCASLAAFYRRLPFVHVEAGLRTGDIHSPFPEELNRRVADDGAALCSDRTLATELAARRHRRRDDSCHRQHGDRRAAVVGRTRTWPLGRMGREARDARRSPHGSDHRTSSRKLRGRL